MVASLADILNPPKLDAPKFAAVRRDCPEIRALEAAIRTAAEKIYRRLGWGLAEKHYVKALATDLSRRHCVEREYPLDLFDGDAHLVRLYWDLVVDRRLGIEVKSGRGGGPLLWKYIRVRRL